MPKRAAGALAPPLRDRPPQLASRCTARSISRSARRSSSGSLRPGARLPATRALARELALSRNTVMAAFEQLHAEGYVDGRVGAGSFVSHRLPEAVLGAPRPAARDPGEPGRAPRTRRRAARG